MQLDSRVGFAETLVPALLAVEVADDVAAARELLRGWDGSQDADSATTAYFNAVWRHLLADTFDDKLAEAARSSGGDRWFEVVGALLDDPDDPFWDDTATAAVERRDDVLGAASTAAHAELTERLGDDPAGWRWGELHRLELVHATLDTSGIAAVERLFNRGPVPTGGSRTR